MPTSKSGEIPVQSYWPFAAGGLVAPFAAIGLARWMPMYIAVGVAMFVAFAAAHLAFKRLSRGKRGSLQGAMLSGAIAGLVAGLLAYVLPWR